MSYSVQAKTLMVVGMHRSGTSLISNWLHHCGLQLGEHLLEAGNGNEEGHFEDVEFLRMHEEILSSNDIPSSGYIYDQAIGVSVYQLEKLKSVINVKNQRYKQWGWKEPRTCLFLDIYRKLLPDAKYLVIFRDYESVVTSLLKRDFAEFEKKYSHRNAFQRFAWRYFRRAAKKERFYHSHAGYYLKIYLEYNQHILKALKELAHEDYIVVNYSFLEKKDKEVFSFLTGHWHFKLNYFSFKDVYKKNLMSEPLNINNFINEPGLIARAKAVEQDLKRYMTLD